MLLIVLLFFFFKQKTAYEMRISDWSSDVCSSDLKPAQRRRAGLGPCVRKPTNLRPYSHQGLPRSMVSSSVSAPVRPPAAAPMRAPSTMLRPVTTPTAVPAAAPMPAPLRPRSPVELPQAERRKAAATRATGLKAPLRD